MKMIVGVIAEEDSTRGNDEVVVVRRKVMMLLFFLLLEVLYTLERKILSTANRVYNGRLFS